MKVFSVKAVVEALAEPLIGLMEEMLAGSVKKCHRFNKVTMAASRY